jgi:hypothetical protein
MITSGSIETAQTAAHHPPRYDFKESQAWIGSILPVQQVKWAEAFVPNPCAKHLPLVYGWSSVDLRLIYISLFLAVVNAF